MVDLNMTFQKKLAAAHQELKDKGISKLNFNPIGLKVLRLAGIKIKPLFYYSFKSIFFVTGTYFGLIWGIAMYLLQWKAQEIPLLLAMPVALLAGSLFGFWMAFYYTRKAKKINLSDWNKL